MSLLVFCACTNLRGWQGLRVSGLASLDKPALVLHGTTLSCFRMAACTLLRPSLEVIQKLSVKWNEDAELR